MSCHTSWAQMSCLLWVRVGGLVSLEIQRGALGPRQEEAGMKAEIIRLSVLFRENEALHPREFSFGPLGFAPLGFGSLNHGIWPSIRVFGT